MSLMSFPPEVRPYEAVRKMAIAELVQWVRRTWRTNNPQDVMWWFDRHAEAFADQVTGAQLEAAIAAALSIDAHLALQGYPYSPDSMIDPGAFGSVDGSGRPVMGLAYAQSLRTAEAFDNFGVDAAEYAVAWRQSGEGLATAAMTAVSDASRAAKSVAMFARPRVSWVRVLTPPSCSRCIVLAGKDSYSPTMDFQRHPGCDCTQAPVWDEEWEQAGAMSGIDAETYFGTMTEAEQDRVFGKASARAIRDGADLNSVVNARRGMTSARDRFTTEATTKMGYASRYMRAAYTVKMTKQPGSRYTRTNMPRLSPEGIYRMAGDDHDMALNLLHRNGYLISTTPGFRRWGSRNEEVKAAMERVHKRLNQRNEQLMKLRED